MRMHVLHARLVTRWASPRMLRVLFRVMKLGISLGPHVQDLAWSRDVGELIQLSVQF